MKPEKWLWPGFFSVMVLALTGYWLTQHWLGPRVSGFSVAKEELVQTLVSSGKIELPAPVEVFSKVNGKVAAVKVAEGQSVTTGQILLLFESKDERLAIEKAKAVTAHAEARFKKASEQTQAGSEQSLKRAKTTLDNAQKHYARIKELSAKGLVGQDQINDALRNVTIGQSQLATAQFQAKANRAKGSEYALAELALHKARTYEHSLRDQSAKVIKAERDGILIACNVVQGEIVQAGKKLMLIAPSDKKQVLAQFEEKNLNDLKLGQQALIAAEQYPAQRFNAAISAISTVTDAANGMVVVKLDAGHTPEYLQQGMPVSVEIEVMRHADALTLPIAAIRDAESAEPWVMRVENGWAQRRAVKLGLRTHSKIEILEGLREGDDVLPATGVEVEEGKRIRLARANTAQRSTSFAQ